jgi:2-dehydropantoate 2-reductase
MVLIIGAGAVGTILASYLAAAGRPIKLYAREADLAAFSAADRICIDRVTGRPPLIAPKPVLTTSLDLEGIDYVLICVKFPDLDSVLDALPQPLPAKLTLVSTLNGIGALRHIRERFPGQPAVSMSILFNGQLLEPLHARITTRPQVLAPSDDPGLRQLFAGSGMKVIAADGESAAWGKLLINLANAMGAVTHTTFRDFLTQPDLRRIYADLIAEAVHCLRSAGISFKLPLPIPYRAYDLLLRHGGQLLWLLVRSRNGLSDGAYPSMVADIEAGRPTEIEQLNGEVVRLAREHGLGAPLNAKLVELVHALEQQKPPRYLTPAELRAKLIL